LLTNALATSLREAYALGKVCNRGLPIAHLSVSAETSRSYHSRSIIRPVLVRNH